MIRSSFAAQASIRSRTCTGRPFPTGRPHHEASKSSRRGFGATYGPAIRALDTNVLVQLVARDEPVQLAAAEAFVKPGAWVSHLALMEAVWVLDSVYELEPKRIAAVLERLLGQTELAFEDPDVVAAALALYAKRPRLGFADCLILEVARKAGHIPLGTFDRDIGKLGRLHQKSTLEGVLSSGAEQMDRFHPRYPFYRGMRGFQGGPRRPFLRLCVENRPQSTIARGARALEWACSSRCPDVGVRLGGSFLGSRVR